jgi:hypothetical protein
MTNTYIKMTSLSKQHCECDCAVGKVDVLVYLEFHYATSEFELAQEF